MDDERPERFITIWCPDWPIVAAGFDHDTPVAVMRAHRVIARSAAAADEGVVVGHRRRQAQQRCPLVELLDDDPARDAREFESVVRAVADIVPRVDVVEPGWLCAAVRGPSRYFGGDAATADHLATVVTAALGRDDVPVGTGVADGRFASGIAARIAARRRGTGVAVGGESQPGRHPRPVAAEPGGAVEGDSQPGRAPGPVIIEPGGSPEFCSSLPIGWLQALGEADAELVELFVRLGLRRLGDLAALPASDVLGRFGPEGVHAHRLASGADRRPPSTTDPAPERRLDRVLDDPVAQTETVIFVAKQLADRLTGTLGAEGRVCTRLVVLLETENGERHERSWYRSAGLSATAMVERVRWQLDGWINQPRGSENEITAGVSLIRLTPDEVRADEGEQLGLWGGQSEADRRAVRAIARLTTLTSEHAVTVPVWHGGRLPSDRYRWVPATTADLDRRDRVRASTATTLAGGAVAPDRAPWPGSLPVPSPATVFTEARPVEVVDAAGEVVRVSGRGVVSAPPAAIRPLSGGEDDGWRRGPSQPIESWAGPWPVDQHWWDPERHRRLARFQFVTASPPGAANGRDEGVAGLGQALLVVAEHRRWWLIATYD